MSWDWGGVVGLCLAGQGRDAGGVGPLDQLDRERLAVHLDGGEAAGQGTALYEVGAQADGGGLAEAGIDGDVQRAGRCQDLNVDGQARLLAEGGHLDDIVHAGGGPDTF